MLYGTVMAAAAQNNAHGILNSAAKGAKSPQHVPTTSPVPKRCRGQRFATGLIKTNGTGSSKQEGERSHHHAVNVEAHPSWRVFTYSLVHN